MILTLTPNPSLDLLFQADRLVWDDANRLDLPRRRPGGQGVNVVRAARSLGGRARARSIALLGGATGRDLEASLASEGTPVRAVPGSGETRVFVGVREGGTGRSLLLNPRGAEAGEAEAAAMLAAVEEELSRVETEGAVAWVACCGSLPPGLAPDLYARVGRLARSRGHRFVPDCDGEALRLAAEAGCDLLVPNVHEAERLLDRTIRGVGDAVEAAKALLAFGPDVAVVTLGAQGAVLAAPDGAWSATPDLPDPLRWESEAGSAVGAGDALLAALLLALVAGGEAVRTPAEALADALANGVAAGTATLLSRGTDLVTAGDVRRVRRHVRVSPA